MRHHLLLTIVAIAVGTRLAAADDAPALDEAAFVAALEAHDPRLAQLAAAVAVAEAEVSAASVRDNPTLAIDREEVFPDGGTATHYLRVTVPIDLVGRRTRRVAAARTEARALAADTDTARSALVVDGLRTFYQTAHARAHLALLRADRDTLARAAEVVRTRSSAGAASGYDLQRIELELAAYDDRIATADDAHQRSRAELGGLVGIAAVDAATTLELPAAPAPIEALAVDATTTRGDHRAAGLRADTAAQRAALARRGWIPAFGISAGAMSAEGGDDTAYGYTIGLTLSLPLFDRGQGDRARAEAERRHAEAERRVLDATVPVRIRVARDALARRIEQSRRLATAQLARLDDLVRAAETGYREGATGIVELLDAYRTARETRLRDLELRRDAQLDRLELWLALGRRP